MSFASELSGTDFIWNLARYGEGLVKNRHPEFDRLPSPATQAPRASFEAARVRVTWQRPRCLVERLRASIDHFVVAPVSVEPGTRCQIWVWPNNGMPMYG